MTETKKFTYTPIEEKKSFKHQGFDAEFLAYNQATDLYLYELTRKAEIGKKTYDGKIHYWEVVKPVKRKDENGKVINTYPSTEMFGAYGKCTRYLYKAIQYFINGI